MAQRELREALLAPVAAKRGSKLFGCSNDVSHGGNIRNPVLNVNIRARVLFVNIRNGVLWVTRHGRSEGRVRAAMGRVCGSLIGVYAALAL